MTDLVNIPAAVEDDIDESTITMKQICKQSTTSVEREPIIYPIEIAPKCDDCAKENKFFFQFDCAQCRMMLDDDATSISQLIAIMRQWSQSIQQNIKSLITNILKKNGHPNDRDGLTDMTIFHFVCKSGAPGMGNSETTVELAEMLIKKMGADPNLICRWNGMTALEIATFYDNASLVAYLLTERAQSERPLHIAASNLCLNSAKVLLNAGGNVLLKDQFDRTPLDCVPEDKELEKLFMWDKDKYQDLALELRALLEEATLALSGEQSTTDMETLKTAKVVLSALGLEIGERVVVGNAKVGILRYCGPTQFSSGIWTGVELDEPIGKNDGSIDGIQYFICAPNHGIFAPLNKISKFDLDEYDLLMQPIFCQQFGQANGKMHISHPGSMGIDMTTVHSKIDTGLNRSSRFSESGGILSSSNSSVNSENIHIGSKVFLTDKKSGIVRFIGMTQFASGIWYGIELTRPLGKNDGSVHGVRYFHCPDHCGIFVQFPRISRLLQSDPKTASSSFTTPEVFESDDTSSDLSMPISGTSSLDIAVRQSPSTNGNDRSANMSNRTPLSNGNNSLTTSAINLSSTLRRSMSLRRSISISRTTSKTTLNSASNNNNKEHGSWLRIGVNVLVNSSIAVLRYIGPVHFTDGIFLGVELRSPTGKNDGTIDGVRYFTCKPNHGLLVRPQKVSVRGINASNLVSDQTVGGTTVKSKEI